MAATIIKQMPKNGIELVNQDLMFVVSNDQAVANELRVKFCAEVYVNNIAQTFTASELIGTFKTTPNNVGRGHYDMRSVVEPFCQTDNLATKGAQFKTFTSTPGATQPIPLQVINKFSKSERNACYYKIRFYVEYLGANYLFPDVIQEKLGTEVWSGTYYVMNGYVKPTDTIDLQNSGTWWANYGHSMGPFTILNGAGRNRFLTNMPISTTFAQENDYGTLSMSVWYNALNGVKFSYYNGTTLLATETVLKTTANGAYNNYNANPCPEKILHIGCFPGNLKNWSTLFVANLPSITHYTVIGITSTGVGLTDTRKINIKCPSAKGYLPVRLCWLNQYGVWDYYTFTQKSVRKTETTSTTYTQLTGTYNEALHLPLSYKGGIKTFRVNSNEKITVNTDYETEDMNIIFEELINSSEIYIVNPYEGGNVITNIITKYVLPVKLTTKSIQRKTRANDNLIQYTFDLEYSRNLRTQAV